MLFYSFFKTMVGKEVAVELKNDLAITGKLHSVRGLGPTVGSGMGCARPPTKSSEKTRVFRGPSR